jgi:hypothetical protein
MLVFQVEFPRHSHLLCAIAENGLWVHGVIQIDRQAQNQVWP